MDSSLEHQYRSEVHHEHPSYQVAYPLLSHSTAALLNNLPSNGDNKPLARQKRRRTSPKDQATLEAAYKRDPKPDKPARLELAKQVSLEEREVQIWFQNRRQSTRRKSRPLLPHEIVEYQLSRSIEAARDSALKSQEHLTVGVKDASSRAQRISGRPEPTLDGPNARPIQENVEQPVDLATFDPAAAVDGERSDTYGVVTFRSFTQVSSTQKSLGIPHDCSPSVQAILKPSSNSRAKSQAMNHHKKDNPLLRLSTSFDGKACVINKDGSPSPPRASARSMLPIAESNQPQPSESPPIQAPGSANHQSLQRSISGRSRDARAWEFWCDKEARGELEDKAEKDSYGSAANAIGLLRSASGRSISRAIPTNGSFFLHKHPLGSRSSKPDMKYRHLQRSNVALGRGHGGVPTSAVPLPKPQPKPKYSELAAFIYVPSTGSDKENCSPDDLGQPGQGLEATMHSTVQRPSHRGRLCGNDSAENSMAMTLPAKGTEKANAQYSSAKSTTGPENESELATFVQNRGNSNSASDEDELDCVQGLLSLSQGHWR